MFLADMDFKRRNGGPFIGGASQAKRGKTAGEWEDSPSQFEEELSMFDEAEMDAEEMEGQAGHDVIPVGGCCTEKHSSTIKYMLKVDPGVGRGWMLQKCNGSQLLLSFIPSTYLSK